MNFIEKAQKVLSLTRETPKDSKNGPDLSELKRLYAVAVTNTMSSPNGDADVLNHVGPICEEIMRTAKKRGIRKKDLPGFAVDFAKRAEEEIKDYYVSQATQRVTYKVAQLLEDIVGK